MTFNLGKAEVATRAQVESSRVMQVIKTAAPDILVLQEATEWEWADGSIVSWPQSIATTCGFGDNYYFSPTISLRDNFRTEHRLMVDALFHDITDWRLGLAICSRQPFMRLGDSSTPGWPARVPLYRTPLYEGDRNTEPRDALIARVGSVPLNPFVVATHWTTLLHERGLDADPNAYKRAREIRTLEATRILELLRENILIPGHPVMLLGDLNADQDEASVRMLREEGGFTLLEGAGRTHPKVDRAIDHILVYPADWVRHYECWSIEDSGSDHSAVIADLEID